MQDKKKVDIFSLYQKEKKITIEDDSGNFVEILLVKMTQGERAKLLKRYNEFLEEERLRLRAREEKLGSLALSLKSYVAEDFAFGILAFEKAQRAEIADLYPALEGKTQEEKDKIIADELLKFEEKRKKELLEKPTEELREQFLALTLDSQALIEAVRILNFESLAHMCVDPETKERIFQSMDDVEKISDRRVLDALIAEMLKFRSTEAAKEVRSTASSDESFLPAGESQDGSTGSPSTTEQK